MWAASSNGMTIPRLFAIHNRFGPTHVSRRKSLSGHSKVIDITLTEAIPTPARPFEESCNGLHFTIDKKEELHYKNCLTST